MTPQPPYDPSQPYRSYPQGQPHPPTQSYPPGYVHVPGSPTFPAPLARSGRSGSGALGRLGPGQKAALYVGGATLAVLLLCIGGVATLGALTSPPPADPAARTEAAEAGGPSTTQTPAATGSSPTATGSSPTAPTPPPTPTQPVVETKTVTETRPIPFKKRTVQDPSLAKGKTQVRTRGVAGVKKLTYEVTVSDGVETGRKLVREEITRQPVTEVVAVGTKETTRRCDPNYSGACVPIASDVDCAGGSGDGPAYVRGPVKVIGTDKYRLDHDGDGYGCE